jgi:hypothetical protein
MKFSEFSLCRHFDASPEGLASNRVMGAERKWRYTGIGRPIA